MGVCLGWAVLGSNGERLVITNYTELKDAIQRWLDNNNTNVVAAIPDAIAMAESRMSRVLRVWEMECRTITPLLPAVPVEEELGYYGLPNDWAGHKSVVRRSSDLIIIYTARIQPLSNTNNANWLLLKYPDVYLYGALLELSAFAKSATEIERWSQAYSTALAEIIEADWKDTYSEESLDIRSSVSSGSLEYITPKEYDELEASGEDAYDSLSCSSDYVTGYFTVSAGAIRIWPKPAMP